MPLWYGMRIYSVMIRDALLDDMPRLLEMGAAVVDGSVYGNLT